MAIKQTVNGHFGTGVVYRPASATIRDYVTGLSNDNRVALRQKCESNIARAIRNHNPKMELKWRRKLANAS